MAYGQGVRDTAADVDARNARNARTWAEVAPRATATLLARNGAHLAVVLGGLRDEDLARRAPFGPAAGALFAVADLAPQAARHPSEHLAHARSAIAAAREASGSDQSP